MDEYICKYCGKKCKNPNSLRNHERLCKSNPDRQIPKNNFAEWNIKRTELNIPHPNQFTKAEKLGLPKPKVSEKTRLKLREKGLLRRHSQEEKDKLSETMRRIAKENPDKYSASQLHKRSKHYNINGFKIDGTWELIVVEYLNKSNIEWIKPKKPFEYTWNGSIHNYYPDFYLPKYDRYIEVKGYETSRDLEKYKAVPNIILIKATEIKEIQANKYNIFEFL